MPQDQSVTLRQINNIIEGGDGTPGGGPVAIQPVLTDIIASINASAGAMRVLTLPTVDLWREPFSVPRTMDIYRLIVAAEAPGGPASQAWLLEQIRDTLAAV
ncbi:hypothetical protein LCGC14_1176350 [marine sediment metagenome]|uniref:Uncharacterized protein n=1 Tax=marine sediment metagenome TaxID=412755 RepID=A0A0F9LNG3_9ZZZZ